MKLKAVIIAAALAVLAAAAGALYYSGTLNPFMEILAGFPERDEQKAVGALAAVTPTSVTIAGQDGAQKTFAIGPDTLVISQVAAGETGKALGQIPLKSPVMIVPGASRTVAASISLLPPLPPAPPPGAEIVTTEGAMASKTADSITLRMDDGTSVRFLVTASTSVVSKVEAGGVGAGFDSLEFRDRVSAFGARNEDGSVEALQLLILPPSAADGANR
jgi:hypothetical protein